MQVNQKSFKVTRGTSYAVRRVKRQAELTKEMLASGSWKDAAFKAYNFKTLGAPCGGGNLHPLLKVRLRAREVDRPRHGVTGAAIVEEPAPKKRHAMTCHAMPVQRGVTDCGED